jgi:hypothetical protein
VAQIQELLTATITVDGVMIMFIRNFKDIFVPKDVIYVDYETKEYLQSKGFLPIGYKDRMWAFHKTETLTNILKNLEKGGNGR